MKTEVVKVFLQKRLADKDIYYVNYTLITDNDFIVCNQQSIDEIIQKYYELKEKYKKQSLLLNKINEYRKNYKEQLIYLTILMLRFFNQNKNQLTFLDLIYLKVYLINQQLTYKKQVINFIKEWKQINYLKSNERNYIR